ncbi:MAG: cysteine hydrolase [Sulfolobales archaeon]|nr:cysteine hydrolase [Sulfolobales archaeon]MCX8198978.1 cysteine hydrolase [Sulfolobales archaeon]MDW8169957.1 isochorismatase family cysteine hydrolase [Desulfurococcaceae archaeon]
MKPALLVIDMLHEFVRGRLKSPRAEDIVFNIRALINHAHSCGVPVIHLVDNHLPIDHELKIWGPHAIKGSPEAKIIDELMPVESDLVLFKRSYSGFRDTGLDILLRDLGVKTLLLTGIHTHICVLHTAWDAFYYGYDIYVVKDAVAAFSEEDHKYALNYMEKTYGAKLITTQEAVELMKASIVKNTPPHAS